MMVLNYLRLMIVCIAPRLPADLHSASLVLALVQLLLFAYIITSPSIA